MCFLHLLREAIYQQIIYTFTGNLLGEHPYIPREQNNTTFICSALFQETSRNTCVLSACLPLPTCRSSFRYWHHRKRQGSCRPETPSHMRDSHAPVTLWPNCTLRNVFHCHQLNGNTTTLRSSTSTLAYHLGQTRQFSLWCNPQQF